MSKRTVAERIRAAVIAARQDIPASVPRDDYKERASALAEAVLRRLQSDPKAQRVALAMGIDSDRPRSTLRAIEALFRGRFARS